MASRHSKKKRRNWTAEEILVVRKFYELFETSAIAKYLNRSEEAVEHMARQESRRKHVPAYRASYQTIARKLLRVR